MLSPIVKKCRATHRKLVSCVSYLLILFGYTDFEPLFGQVPKKLVRPMVITSLFPVTNRLQIIEEVDRSHQQMIEYSDFVLKIFVDVIAFRIDS